MIGAILTRHVWLGTRPLDGNRRELPSLAGFIEGRCARTRLFLVRRIQTQGRRRPGRAFFSMRSRSTHRPLLQILLGSALERYLAPDTVAFLFGAGGSLLSDLCGRFLCWLMFYVAILGFYRIVPPMVRGYCARRWPNSPTAAVPDKLVANMIEVSHHAFPLYVTVPLLTDLFMVKGWSRACDTVEDCGGPVRSVLGCILYFFALECVIFFDHYYFLHKWSFGKRMGQHAYHHVYKYADQLNAFSGYSFAPQDGWSQGMALPLCTLFVPVPVAFVYAMEIMTGFWTLYIHTDVCPLPWPLMGCDYHYIHHRWNWYNFGFMTVTLDTLFNTVKHPKHDAFELSRGAKPMPEAEKARSSELSDAILQKRGREALSSDDAAGEAGAWSSAPAPSAEPRLVKRVTATPPAQDALAD